MKKFVPFTLGIFLLTLSTTLKAQTKTSVDFFEGKWKVLVTGTPYGDLKRIYVLEKKDNALAGVVQDSTGKEVTKFSKVEVKENEVTLYYSAMGNDISVVLTKKDDDHISGSVLGSFPATGERIK